MKVVQLKCFYTITIKEAEIIREQLSHKYSAPIVSLSLSFSILVNMKEKKSFINIALQIDFQSFGKKKKKTLQ